MEYEGSIRAVNLLIRDHVANNNISSHGLEAANLCYKRFSAKFEEPRSDNATNRRTAAWERWIDFDGQLRPRGLLGPHWARARLLVHKILSGFRMGPLTFTNGSSYEPLGNRLSVACKLTGSWTITDDCFDLFCRYSYWHRAIKHAVKKRFQRYCTTHGHNLKCFNRYLWLHFRSSENVAYEIYSFKLWCIVTFVRGNRWSTVPKNNLKDRSICLEPLCNMLVQRAVGLGLRKCLKDNLGIDLDHLADVHRYRISDKNVATIDLSDCSDAVSMWLIKYLLPTRIFNLIRSSRSDMTLGPDSNFYVVNKVSSMGNGFTFDLMTVVLTALTRAFDPQSTVFGDDIICRHDCADDVVNALRVAGFVVNLEKTNIRTGYRESCGAHYLDGYGYVTCFDVKWVTSIHELISTVNKVGILSHIYGEPYTSLQASIWACLPRTLLGAATRRLVVDTGKPPAYELSEYIRYGPPVQVDPKRFKLKVIRRGLKHIQKVGHISVGLAFYDVSSPASGVLRSSQWDMYFQYIHSMRRTKKIPDVTVKSSLVARVGEEQIGFVDSLLP